MEHGSSEEMPPPWAAVPDLDPWLPATQGLPEWYIGLNWLPFWQTLTPDAKADYLERWDAPDEWREVIADRYDEQKIDWEAERSAQVEWRRANMIDPPPRRWWQWWRLR